MDTTYDMKGMGSLLNMYGQAGGKLEKDYNQCASEYHKAKSEYKNNKTRELKKKVLEAREARDNSRVKMQALLNGISKSTGEASDNLKGGDLGVKTANEKLDSNFTTGTKIAVEKLNAAAKIADTHLTSGVKIAGEKLNTLDKHLTEGTKIAVQKLSDGVKMASSKLSDGAKMASSKLSDGAKMASDKLSNHNSEKDLKSSLIDDYYKEKTRIKNAIRDLTKQKEMKDKLLQK